MGVSAGVGLNLLAASADDSVVRLVLIALVCAASPDEQVGLMRKALVPLAGSVGAARVALLIAAAPRQRITASDMDCSDFSSQAAAQYHMNAHPGDLDGLDGNDDDGRACESNPCPCYLGSATQPELPAVLLRRRLHCLRSRRRFQSSRSGSRSRKPSATAHASSA